MIFEKPKGVRYVDMCIFIDEKVASGNVSPQDEATIYQYLYLLIHMLSIKQKFFKHKEDYDDFSLSYAGDVYRRLFTNPKLDEINEDGTPKMTKIKSCLNYIKTTLYGRKVSWEQSNYSQKYVNLDDMSPDINSETFVSSFNSVRDSMQFDIALNMDLYLGSISKTIKQYVYNNSPYINDKMLIKNIYISCLLSIMNAITFTEADQNDLLIKYTTPEAKDRYLYKMYATNRENCIILYHLSSKYYDYIQVLVKQLFTVIGNNIREIINEKISIPEDVLLNISLSEISGNIKNEY